MLRSSGWLVRGLRSVAESPFWSAQSSSSGTKSLKPGTLEHTGQSFAGASVRRDAAAVSPKTAEREALRRVLNSAIDEITEKFDQTRLECDAVPWDPVDRQRWKGEMIAYAHAIAVLERLKRLHAGIGNVEKSKMSLKCW
jgi:hypothetical protein